MAAAQMEKKYVWALSKNKELLVFYPTQQTVQMERLQTLMESVLKHLIKMSILFKMNSLLHIYLHILIFLVCICISFHTLSVVLSHQKYILFKNI